jgi:hypothetical protein
MPVWFAPAIFQGLMLAARAAAPHVARLFTQAGATAARAGTSMRNAASAAGPLTTVGAGVGALVTGANLLGVVPQQTTQSGSSQTSSNTTVSNHTLGEVFTPTGGNNGNRGNNAGDSQPQDVIAPEVSSIPPEPLAPPPPPPDPPNFQAVKAAPIDTVTFVDEPYDEGFYADILFEDFSGQELLSISRSDTVNGQRVSYQPFKDLGIIRDQYNPSNLLSIQETSDRFFANFLIKLNEKIPNVGEGPDGKTVYFDSSTGNGIIEFININADEQAEIQILNAGIIEDIGI